MDIQSIYQKTIIFAALKHSGQIVKESGIPYIVHLSNVAMEIFIASLHTANFNVDFAIQVSLLHDTLEDTSTTAAELAAEFGSAISEAVLALTKNDGRTEKERMPDSLKRIKYLQKEVWAIKLADRITNLQPPPGDWDHLKKIEYKSEAIEILQELKGGNAYLENRLQQKIIEYDQFINDD